MRAGRAVVSKLGWGKGSGLVGLEDLGPVRVTVLLAFVFNLNGLFKLKTTQFKQKTSK